MIEREEILAKAEEFGINASDVQRDYVFGWLIGGVYQASTLRDVLVLKGGNGLRKAYFPMTRFSDDLDFSTSQGLDGDGRADPVGMSHCPTRPTPAARCLPTLRRTTTLIAFHVCRDLIGLAPLPHSAHPPYGGRGVHESGI
jgi:nucleotidyltransferase AbiEii toxin of type IV toxin-antitoxin system